MKPTVIKFNQTQYLNVSASENIKEILIAICETLDETETVYSTVKPPIKLKKKMKLIKANLTPKEFSLPFPFLLAGNFQIRCL